MPAVEHKAYETIFIVPADLEESVVASLQERVKEVCAKDGEVQEIKDWGIRKLAYEIKRQRRGRYFLMNYSGGITCVAEVERALKLSENVMRFMTVRLDNTASPLEVAKREFKKIEMYDKSDRGDRSRSAR